VDFSTRSLLWRVAALAAGMSMLLAACSPSSSSTQATPLPQPAATTAIQAPAATTAPLNQAATVPAAAGAAASAVPLGTAETSVGASGSATPGAAVEASASATPGTAGALGATGNGEAKLNPNVSGNVEFWHFWGSPVRRNAIRRVIAICQQQLPNIHVTDTFKPFGDIWTANIAAVAAGSGMPDVIVEDRPKLPQLAAQNVESSLQDLAQRDGVTGSNFWPFTWQQTLYKDQTYGIPWETDVRVLFYDKNAFQEAGLDPNKPPKTWDELWSYADKLDKKNADGSYARIAFMPLWNAGPDIWGYTNSVDWAPNGQPKVNQPGAVQTFEWIKKWVDRYGGWQKIQNFQAGFSAPPNDMFMSGKVAMVVDIAGYSSQLNFYRPQYTGADGKKANMDWAVSDAPYNTKPGMWSGGFALSIPRGAKNRDAAWEFIKCATSAQAQASWARDTYAIPANMAAAKDPTLMADPNWQTFIKAMDYSTGGEFVAGYPNYFEQVSQRQENIWKGSTSVQQALDDAQKAIDAQIARQK
jgi:multiple sugar transport system substrate-binding protein